MDSDSQGTDKEDRSFIDEFDLATVNRLRGAAKTHELSLLLSGSSEDNWPIVSNTEQQNIYAGNGVLSSTYKHDSAKGSTIYVETKAGPSTMKYVELNMNWLRPVGFSLERFYLSGANKYMSIDVKISELGAGASIQTQIDSVFTYVPRYPNVIVRAISKRIHIKFLDFIRGQHGQNNQTNRDLSFAANLDDPGKYRREIELLNQRWESLTADKKISSSIAEFIFCAPDIFVQKIRPYEMCEHYELAKRETVEFFLSATRAGYLNMNWDLICPRCRGAKVRTSELKDLPADAHCDACNIQYGASFDRNVELTFAPHSRIRSVIPGEFCTTSPIRSSHVQLQQCIDPGSNLDIELRLDPGEYSFLDAGLVNALPIRVGEDGESTLSLSLGQEFKSEEILVTSPLKLHVENRDVRFRVVKLLRQGYREYSVTAAEVTSLQKFRDLFGSQVLSPDVQIGVSNIVLMFTDLKDSTRMYDGHGDAEAYSLVKDHFTVLQRAIADSDGSIVKTIGDAVMAVFCRPLSAIEAAFEVHSAISKLNESKKQDKHLVVKIGIHGGSALCINDNGTLDYFGSMVNKAARVQGLSRGGDVVISQELFKDEDVARYVSSELSSNRLKVAPFAAELKGIGGSSEVYRLTNCEGIDE